MAKKRAIDVEISGGFGFYLFMLNTRKAVTWARTHVHADTYQCAGDTFCCDDTRMAMDIAAAMHAAGLAVR